MGEAIGTTPGASAIQTGEFVNPGFGKANDKNKSDKNGKSKHLSGSNAAFENPVYSHDVDLDYEDGDDYNRLKLCIDGDGI